MPKITRKPTLGPGDPVHLHVRAALAARLAALQEHEAGTRSGADAEDLHQMRVAVRRLRAMLKAARPFLDRKIADRLRAELGWLGRALGPVRDLDVLLERLTAEAENFPDDERAAVHTLVAGLHAEREQARAALHQALDAKRYQRLLSALAAEAASTEPGPPVDTLTALSGLVRGEFDRLARAVAKAGPDPVDDVLHALRIDGKRLRYTAELALPLLGKKIRPLLKATTDFQDVLGEHQDACVAQDRVRALLGAHGEVIDFDLAFVGGRLVEREEARRVSRRAAWWTVWLTLEQTGRSAL
ncbi:CHAD domain-containing protein [Crossiella sp. CA198]|uniref:CHAD domain-containing protein n=1 Tax=Crossiella sp. CA198 TaxID=3455607 RepID=UPI003F8D4982